MLSLFGDMEAIGKLVQSRLLQHHHRSHQELKDVEVDGGDEEELGRVKSEVTHDDSIERDEKSKTEETSRSSNRPSLGLGGTFSIDSLLR